MQNREPRAAQIPAEIPALDTRKPLANLINDGQKYQKKKAAAANARPIRAAAT
jgi:hypothetical protein